MRTEHASLDLIRREHQGRQVKSLFQDVAYAASPRIGTRCSINVVLYAD